ncbi:MAG: hypothetical protein Q8M71_11715 [Thermodesulfovibrionales bacterium]|nr:hypothetical protein [Thermodesulfovibrionales bacterium]
MKHESKLIAKGESVNQRYRAFFQLQKYGAKKAKELKLTEKDIEKLIFDGR